MNRPMYKMSDYHVCKLLILRPGQTQESRELSRIVVARIRAMRAAKKAA